MKLRLVNMKMGTKSYVQSLIKQESQSAPTLLNTGTSIHRQMEINRLLCEHVNSYPSSFTSIGLIAKAIDTERNRIRLQSYTRMVIDNNKNGQ